MSRRSLLLAFVLSLACRGDGRGPTAPIPMALPAIASGEVRVVLTLSPVRDGVALLQVRVDARDLELGAYQGQITFDPSVLEVVGTNKTDADYQTVNLDETTVGRVRFAAFAATGFTSSIALDLLVRPTRPLRSDELGVALDVIGTVEGERIEPTRVKTVPPLVDFTGAPL